MKRLYLWQDLNGTQHILVAKSLSEAKQRILQQQGYFFNLTAKGYLTHRSFHKQELIVITKQLATMLKAGLPIVESLALLADEHPLASWQWLLNDLKKQLMTGKSLSQALSHYPEIFPPIYKELVATGELTGQLDHSFDKLALQLENTQQLQKRVKKAMRYPLFLLSVSIIVTLIMLLVVLPKFAEVYQNFDAQLPMFTQAIITLSEGLQHYFIPILGSLITVYMIYRYYLKRHYHAIMMKYLLNLPIFGKIITTSCLAQIFQTLFITQKSGIPLISGLEAAQKTAFNLLFQHSLLQIVNTIEQGHSFSQAINQHPLYPSLCVQLIRVGEESGTLDLMLERLADYYQQKGIELTDNLSQKIEPLMMSIMAIIIGSLVIAMYLPVFQLGNVIH